MVGGLSDEAAFLLWLFIILFFSILFTLTGGLIWQSSPMLGTRHPAQ